MFLHSFCLAFLLHRETLTLLAISQCVRELYLIWVLQYMVWVGNRWINHLLLLLLLSLHRKHNKLEYTNIFSVSHLLWSGSNLIIDGINYLLLAPLNDGDRNSSEYTQTLTCLWSSSTGSSYPTCVT